MSNIEIIKNSHNAIFNVDVQYIVIPVNLVGVMGAGIAKVIRDEYPLIYRHYKHLCFMNNHFTMEEYTWSIGQLVVTQDPNSGKRFILFPTKEHWKNPSQIEWIEAGLDKLASTYKTKGITDIASPLLGCGQGGLDKDEIIQLFHDKLGNTDLVVKLFT